MRTAEDILAVLDAGDLCLTYLANYAQQLVEPDHDSGQLELIPRRPSKIGYGKRDDVQTQDVSSLLTQMAGYRQPLPGDPIVGYIMLGRGVTTHRQDCVITLQLAGCEPERMIQVGWGSEPVRTYLMDIAIRAHDRPDLLRDVSQVLLNERINTLAMNTCSNKEDNTTTMQLAVEIPDLDALRRLLAHVSQLPNIIEARRSRAP